MTDDSRSGAPVWSRRRLLMQVGAAGGSAAMFRVGAALGWVPGFAAAARPALAPVGGRRSVVILGAGISGLVAAYELGRAGYRCTILEASHRAGGRNLTLRHGDKVDELGHPQVCPFDDDPDLYLNAGAARIPSVHERLLEYCRELNVELAPFVNENRSAWVQDDAMFGGRRVRNREYVTDARGFMAELLAKGIQSHRIDAELDALDVERLLGFLRTYGDLDDTYVYRGSSRAGYRNAAMIEAPQLKGVLDISELLKSNFWRSGMNFAEGEDQAPMMMEPVGGMDKVVDAFMRHVGKVVHLNAPVESIALRDGAVDVVYRTRGRSQRISADYCLDCIPMHILNGIDHNFPADYAAAFAAVGRGKYFKLGLQARERFWERERIYGGISWTAQDITQIWYPAHGIHRRKGVLLGAYTFGGPPSDTFANLAPEARIERAIAQGEKIHPNYREFIECGVSVAWHQMNHLLGCAAEWTEPLYRQWFARLLAPVGNHYLIGDQVSLHPGWQEGAIHSALHAIGDIDRREHARAGGVA